MATSTPKASPIASLPGLCSVILDPSQLSAQPFLEHLRTAINTAYQNHHADVIDRNNPASLRFPDTDSLSANLGTHGRCCLVFRDEDEQDPKPVASAMVKYFHAKNTTQLSEEYGGQVTGYAKEPEYVQDIEHWEISAVAIVDDDPALKGRGLAAYMTRHLEQDVRRRMQASKAELAKDGGKARENGSLVTNDSHDGSSISDSTNTRPPYYAPKVTFWSIATLQSNAPYWQRRGFTCVRMDTYPKGHWGGLADFQIMTLKKEVPSTTPIDV